MRFAQVDTELRRAEAYFTRLRDELGDSHGATVADAILRELRHLRFGPRGRPGREQERQAQGREIQRHLYGKRDES
jgi:hypothetical protein